MNIKNAIFACTTPYQIMGAINIILADKIDADLIIFGLFKDYESVAERIRKCRVFSDVYVVPTERSKCRSQYDAGWQMIKAKSIVNEFLPRNIAYKTCYSSSRAHIKNILIHELIRRNRKLQIIIYDDGMGSYSEDSHVLNTSVTRRKIEKYLRWELFSPENVSFLIYEPLLFEKPKELNTCKVMKMPKQNENSKASEIISYVFGMTPEDNIRERVILFDPLRGFDEERDKKLITIDKCYEIIVEKFGYENVILKEHPRSIDNTDINIKVFEKMGIPMEAIYSRMADLENRILITYASTAVYTPKMMFGVEPIVINLFKITDGNNSEWMEQHKKFSASYERKDRILAPDNLDELEMIITNLTSEI